MRFKEKTLINILIVAKIQFSLLSLAHLFSDINHLKKAAILITIGKHGKYVSYMEKEFKMRTKTVFGLFYHVFSLNHPHFENGIFLLFPKQL